MDAFLSRSSMAVVSLFFAILTFSNLVTAAPTSALSDNDNLIQARSLIPLVTHSVQRLYQEMRDEAYSHSPVDSNKVYVSTGVQGMYFDFLRLGNSVAVATRLKDTRADYNQIRFGFRNLESRLYFAHFSSRIMTSYRFVEMDMNRLDVIYQRDEFP